MNKIEINEAMVAFSANNIGYIQHRYLIGLRIEGLVIRVRFVIYQILLVALNQSPIAVTLIILLLEAIHIGTYIYYSIWYRYAKNWLLVISKFNIGISVIIICSISLLISVSNWNSKDYNYSVNPYV